jgi:hypothetical protein
MTQTLWGQERQHSSKHFIENNFFYDTMNCAKAEKREYTGMMAFARYLARFFCLGRPIIPIFIKYQYLDVN